MGEIYPHQLLLLWETSAISLETFLQFCQDHQDGFCEGCELTSDTASKAGHVARKLPTCALPLLLTDRYFLIYLRESYFIV